MQITGSPEDMGTCATDSSNPLNATLGFPNLLKDTY